MGRWIGEETPSLTPMMPLVIGYGLHLSRDGFESRLPEYFGSVESQGQVSLQS